MKRNDAKPICAPRIAGVQDGALSASDLHDGARIRDLSVLKADLSRAVCANVTFDNLKMVKSTFQNVDLSGAHFADVVVEESDLSGASTMSGSFLRTEWKACRAGGWQVADACIEDTLFDECKMHLLNMRFSKLKSVTFRNCVLKGADFQGASFANVRFEGCNLAEAEFRQCTVEALDLRTSQIQDIKYVEGLRGATIDALQLIDLAPKMAHVLGLQVV
jgi:uncharacterized protein YjbI with pentapeptide repeats